MVYTSTTNVAKYSCAWSQKQLQQQDVINLYVQNLSFKYYIFVCFVRLLMTVILLWMAMYFFI